MSSVMFIHRVKPLKERIVVFREEGYNAEADQLEEILRKIERGVIRTVTELDKAEESIQWTK